MSKTYMKLCNWRVAAQKVSFFLVGSTQMIKILINKDKSQILKRPQHTKAINDKDKIIRKVHRWKLTIKQLQCTCDIKMIWSLTMTQDRVLKNQDLKEGILKFHFFSKNVSLNLNYTFFDKHQFHKQHQAEIGKKSSKS